MNFLKLLGLQKTKLNPPPGEFTIPDDVIFLEEDNYLMIELQPVENLNFIRAEANRINGFAEDHFDGTGFTDITVIGAPPVKTIEKFIDLAEVKTLFINAGLEKANRFYEHWTGLLEGDSAPLGFGLEKFAIMCDRQNGLLKHIWMTGHIKAEENRQKVIDALLLFGQTYSFMAVNWYRGEYYNLVERSSVEEFVRDCC